MYNFLHSSSFLCFLSLFWSMMCDSCTVSTYSSMMIGLFMIPDSSLFLKYSNSCLDMIVDSIVLLLMLTFVFTIICGPWDSCCSLLMVVVDDMDVPSSSSAAARLFALLFTLFALMAMPWEDSKLLVVTLEAICVLMVFDVVVLMFIPLLPPPVEAFP